MDFEEFLWAIGDEISAVTIKMFMEKKRPAGNLEQNNLQAVDEIKRDIVDLYEEDFSKIDPSGQVCDLLPDMLSSYTINIVYHAK